MHGEAKSVCINESTEVGAGLALDASLSERVVANDIRAHEYATLADVEVSALSEMEAASHVDAFGNDDHTATINCSLINKSLNLGGVNTSVGKDAVVGEDVLLAEL